MEMATLCAPTHYHKPFSCFRSYNFAFTSNSSTSFFSSSLHPYRPSLQLRFNPNARLALCLAAAPLPPSPPDSDSPRPPGLAGTFSRFKDRVQIFFAVLFWMSLFFWACAWDRSDSGRPKKGSRFRR